MSEKKNRAAKDVNDLLESLSPKDDIASEVVSQGKELLNNTAQLVGNIALSEEQVILVLHRMIKNTPFREASIVRVVYDDHARRYPCYQDMRTIIGRYGSDHAYNVWFGRKGGYWVLYWNKIPQGGNLRASRQNI